ncbi:MAG: transposase, partial [Opitutaceae bacterium]
PKSSLGKACDYLLRQWEPLVAHLHQGESRLDNNLVENAIRPSCIGKNYGKRAVMRSWGTPIAVPAWL